MPLTPGTARRRLPASTLRNPGADLSTLPLGLDFRAISIAEGIRAALAVAVIVFANAWINWPLLNIAALAAYLTCLCDAGGSVRQRVPALLAFTVLGALLWAGFGLLRPAGILVVVPIAAAAIFCLSFARIGGTQATPVGNILTIVVVLALDQPLDLPGAALQGGLFAGGCLWAVLLTLVIWRLSPYRPAQRAVAEAWRQLAAMANDLRDLVNRDSVTTADWEAHARADRRAVRQAIEQARDVVMETLRARGTASPRTTQTLIRLEAGEQLFGMFIGLSEMLEHADPARRARARRLLRVLGPLLVTVARSVDTNRMDRPVRMDTALGRIVADTADDPALRRLTEAIADRVRMAIKITLAEQVSAAGLPAGLTANTPVLPWYTRIRESIRSNLTWKSAVLRHAARAALVGGLALGGTLQWPGPFQHWLTITVVLTMQPFFAATWQRALERIAGTLLGAVVGVGLAFFAGSPLVLAALMFPLCIIGFSMRAVSFGFFIACLTPWIVVFVEVVEPGVSEWTIAGLRALFTVGGGLLAVIATLALWPSWEPDRLRTEVYGAIKAHADYADAALAALLGERPQPSVDQARRAAGMASNNLEASLSRALNEPRPKQRRRLEAALTVDATLRRVAGRLSALQHDPPDLTGLDRSEWQHWRDWIKASLLALASRHEPPSPRPEASPHDALDRMALQIELLDGALGRFRSVS